MKNILNASTWLQLLNASFSYKPQYVHQFFDIEDKDKNDMFTAMMLNDINLKL